MLYLAFVCYLNIAHRIFTYNLRMFAIFMEFVHNNFSADLPQLLSNGRKSAVKAGIQETVWATDIHQRLPDSATINCCGRNDFSDFCMK